jgi:hypothetical protein
MNLFKRISLTVSFCLATTILASAQGVRSPYSYLGMGDIQNRGLQNNAAMGGVGIGSGSPAFINTLNPAFLPLNNIFTFELGGFLEGRSIRQDTLSERYTSGSFSNIVLALPIVESTWTLSFGVQPATTINHSYRRQTFVEGTIFPVENETSVTGGLNEAYISNGFRLNKYLFLGFTGSYLFGTRLEETRSYLTNESLPFANINTLFYERSSFSDLNATGGLGVVLPVKGSNIFTLGATYSLGRDINTKNFIRLDQVRMSDGVTLSSDTIQSDFRTFSRLPANLGLGLSYGKPNKFLIAADIQLADWSVYQTANVQAGTMADRTYIGLGGEIIPEYTSVSSFLKRVTYRAGIHYEETPYIFQGNQIKDFGINFGFTLPLRFNNLNFALRYGQRGETGGSNIKENYFRFGLGINVGDNSWFYRGRYN